MPESLERQGLPADPFHQFESWLQEVEATGAPYPLAMSLATASPTGEVSSRIVLLRYFDQAGFVFFSATNTLAARQMAANRQVALLFSWLGLERQVKVMGPAVTLPTSESLRFFASRRRVSQMGTWLAQENGVISSKSVLRAKWAAIKRQFRAGQPPMPDFWGGYRVRPQSIEFWQGQPDGLHDRLVYVKQDAGWEILRLMP
ncbi:MAG: pyridoxamine 5'-phosphate oxidase [Anaerolineae bacterium]